jgi:hypothetical protein
VLPLVVVQIAVNSSASDGATVALEERLLGACSAGLPETRCVSAGSELERESENNTPQAIAMVTWVDATHVAIEVGTRGTPSAQWLARDLTFSEQDPELERWRAVGLTVALLADPRGSVGPDRAETAARESGMEIPPNPPNPTRDAVAAPETAARNLAKSRISADLRGTVGTGWARGTPRLGGDVRWAVALGERWFATGSGGAAFATHQSFDARWLDLSLGVGFALSTIFPSVEGRVRLEALAENLAITASRSGERDRAGVWVPGALLGGDLLWHMASPWRLSARADVFAVDGATPITDGGRRIGTIAGAGLLLGLGAGVGF